MGDCDCKGLGFRVCGVLESRASVMVAPCYDCRAGEENARIGDLAAAYAALEHLTGRRHPTHDPRVPVGHSTSKEAVVCRLRTHAMVLEDFIDEEDDQLGMVLREVVGDVRLAIKELEK